MSDTVRMKRLRRAARTRGYVVRSLRDGLGTIEVVQCSIYAGGCRATRYDMEHGHWRSHHSIFGGDICAVERWLDQLEPA